MADFDIRDPYERIADETPYAGNMDGEVGGYTDEDCHLWPSHEDETGEDSLSFTIRAYLDYATKEDVEAAVESETLGIHTGNVVLVWGDNQAIVPLHFYHNSPCVHDDASHEWSWETMRPIPFDMAERIHPQAFDTLYGDVYEMRKYSAIAPDLLDHITDRPRYKQYAAYSEWLEADRNGLPGFAGERPDYPVVKPKLGNGESIQYAPEPEAATV